MFEKIQLNRAYHLVASQIDEAIVSGHLKNFGNMVDLVKAVAKGDAKKDFLIGRHHVLQGMKYMRKIAVEKDRQSV